jgi:hypothetical protein
VDTAVALVQAYLHVNGYFTVTEYPVLEAFHRTHARAVTDLDVLAFRFAHAAHDLKRGRGRSHLDEGPPTPDPVLGCVADRPDMIVGEVKEGVARFNAATRDPVVLEVALARFGCCAPPHVGALTQQLLREGRAITDAGHVVRLVAFGDVAEAVPATGTCVPMRHVVEYLQAYLHRHWSVLRHAQIREPTFAVLALLEKWRVSTDATLVASRPGA